MRHPRTMGAPEVLAPDMRMVQDIRPARSPDLWPTVFARRDVPALLDRLEPAFRLIGEMFYGSGLLLIGCMSLHVKDVDLERCRSTMWRGKGEHDRGALDVIGALDR